MDWQPPAGLRLLRYRRLAYALSASLLLASLAGLALRGLNLGLDFTGGGVLEWTFAEPVDLGQVRGVLSGAGVQDAVAVHFGSANEISVRVRQVPSAQKIAALTARFGQLGSGPAELVRQDLVGPSVGAELRDQGGLALMLALGVILLYVAFRFQSKFGVAAVVALAHDVALVVGVFALLQWEFDLTVLGALLAVIGYSLNDTIVVADRIREYLRLYPKRDPEECMDDALRMTLQRTLITSGTTLMVLLSLLAMGGPNLRGFSAALTIGVVVGTYSSVYVVAAMLLALDVSPADVALPEKEGEDLAP